MSCSYGSYGGGGGGGGANQGYGQSSGQGYNQQGYGGYSQSPDNNSGSYNQGGYGGYGQGQSGRTTLGISSYASMDASWRRKRQTLLILLIHLVTLTISPPSAGGYGSPPSNQGGGGYSHSTPSYSSGGYGNNNNQPSSMSYSQQSTFSGYNQQQPSPPSPPGWDISSFFSTAGDVGIEFQPFCFRLLGTTAAHRLLAIANHRVEDTVEEATAAEVVVVGVRLAVMGLEEVTSSLRHHRRSTEEVTTTLLRATAPHHRRVTASRASTARVEVRKKSRKNLDPRLVIFELFNRICMWAWRDGRLAWILTHWCADVGRAEVFTVQNSSWCLKQPNGGKNPYAHSELTC